MSTLEKAMGLLQEMPERKLEAVYMYMRFVNSQTEDDEVIPSASQQSCSSATGLLSQNHNKDVNCIMEISHEYASPALVEKEATTFENAMVEKFTEKTSIEKRQKGFQGLMSFAGTLPEDFDYERELEDAREEKYAGFI